MECLPEPTAPTPLTVSVKILGSWISKGISCTFAFQYSNLYPSQYMSQKKNIHNLSVRLKIRLV